MNIVRYNVRMSRYRLEPAPEQESALLRHCSDARYIWNLAVEQHAWWRPGRTSAPGYPEQSRQLTAARAASPWLAEGSQTVQQQALRDFDQAMRSFFAGTHRRPTWRKAGQHEGFRVVAVKPGDVRRLSRHRAEVKVPKVGWVRFRWSRPVPGDAKSYRVGRSGWGLLASRLEDKAPGRVEKVPAAHTSQRCSACGHVARDNRQSQAAFLCTACNFACNADVNAARNIAAGHAVKARGGDGSSRPMNREPQLTLLAS